MNDGNNISVVGIQTVFGHIGVELYVSRVHSGYFENPLRRIVFGVFRSETRDVGAQRVPDQLYLSRRDVQLFYEDANELRHKVG